MLPYNASSQRFPLQCAHIMLPDIASIHCFQAILLYNASLSHLLLIGLGSTLGWSLVGGRYAYNIHINDMAWLLAEYHIEFMTLECLNVNKLHVFLK
jgi:hypothetical protein